MKKRIMIRGFFVLIVLVFFASNAHAIGFGFNMTGGGGSTNWEAEDWWDGTKVADFDTDDSRVGFGFIFDTTVAKDRLFNYRLNIGPEAVDYDVDGGGTFETRGWFMAHDFGFGIVRKENLRLWVGPEVRLSYSEGELDTDNSSSIDVITMGIGPVLGLNLNLGRTVTLAFKVGALAMSSFGTLEFVDEWGYEDEPDLYGDGSYGFANVGLIFRLGDDY